MSAVLGTDQVVQIGIIVKDVETTATKYAEFLGVAKPDIIITGKYEEALTEYKGQPSEATARLAFFHVGPSLDIELIQPDEKPSTWREFLDEKGEGVHHIAFFIKGMKEKIFELGAQNISLVQKGEYTGGRYAYMDSSKDLKTILELLEND
ncbi:MAG TPA: VOC family protein [Clostridiaceae bacterium]